ncbi:hypothetical protein [Geopsychrobacter electrodiphilus]|uniref:hypothetical protein n=1 Tax=Geopsychrobacter electrodiphilus TaxID=225196 RepID=UPI000380E69E|nr:hypothetical protein [Geopsychrobacter electrodiphilus]
MAIILPKDVRHAVRQTIYAKAEAFDYLHRSQLENSAFMDDLVKDCDVGGIISQYAPKEKIRTYIKDGVLKKYSKRKRERALPSNPEEMKPIVEALFNQKAYEIHSKKGPLIFRLEDGNLLAAATGTLLKWETALRKVLELISTAPGLPPRDAKLHILLVLAVLNCPTTMSDKEQLISALNFIGVKLHFV